MPATNYTPIQLYRSTVSGNQPLAANMSAGEIALNIADNDMSIYMENASGTVKRFFNNPAALKYPTADGTSGQAIVTDGSGNLSFATVGGGALTNNTRQAVTSSATTTINLNSGNVIDLTMAATITTLSFTNVPASGTPILIQIVVKNAASGTTYTITWPNSVYWSGQYSATTVSTVQTAPTLATGANGVTVIALLTTNGGTNWRGWVEGTIPGGVINPSLYVWGYNLTGQLGLNDRAVDRSSPVQVGSLTNWASVSTGTTHCAAVKTDGTLWTWGAPNYGQLGLNDALVARSSPVQVGALTNWSLVSAASQHTVAIKTDGTMWSWGRNQQGQLGQNINWDINRSSPVQIGSGTTWSSVTSGPRQSLALKTDGTMWSWGQNAGYLGLNDTDNRSQPVQIGALTTWSKLSTGYLPFFAIKTDGTLWGWGANSAGELGDGTTVRKSSPVQIGALTTWAAVCMGAAIKTDGTLWTWGPNGAGQAMQNNTVYRSSPVQVGALTNWSTVVSGDSFKLALKTDGTLWAAGANGDGRTGLNLNSISTPGTSSPTQVGALTTWIAVASIIEATSAGIIATPVNPA